MTGDDDGMTWDDARIEAAFRARFGSPEPRGLADRVQAQLAASAASGSVRGGWHLPVLGRVPAASLGAVAMVAVVVAVTFAVLRTAPTGPPPTAGRSDGPAPSGTSSTFPATTFPGATFPAALTGPGSPYRHKVYSVSEAMEVRSDPERQGLVIPVGGWFAFNPVPCPARPGATSQLENCAVDFTWLMESPEQLRELNVDGSGSIHAPSGPAVNAVLAYIDWQAPSDGQPIPVVLWGHFGDERAGECAPGERRTRCAALFVIDTVAWTQAAADTPAALPSEAFGLPVLSVPEALEVQARDSSEELAVTGWYERPPPLYCPPMFDRSVPLLHGGCEDDYTVLMLDPEQLISTTGTGRSVTEPSGPAFGVSFATVLPPPPNALPASGASTPVHVVFIGHFHDRRAGLCAPEDQEECGSRFVVDAVAWVEGFAPYPNLVDWRGSTDAWLQPAVDPVALAQATAAGTAVLGMAVMPGRYIGDLEPALTHDPVNLSAEPSLWVVTALVPAGPCAGQPQSCEGLGQTAVTIVVRADGTAYRDSGAGFVQLP